MTQSEFHYASEVIKIHHLIFRKMEAVDLWVLRCVRVFRNDVLYDDTTIAYHGNNKWPPECDLRPLVILETTLAQISVSFYQHTTEL